MDDLKHLNFLLTELIQRHTAPEAFQWLQEKKSAIEAEGSRTTALNTAFAAVPRKVGTAVLSLTQKEVETFASAQPPLFINNWTLDRLCRVWLLLQVPADDKGVYIAKIENLFSAAAMNEQVALYSALPLLQYPQVWQQRCAEGIRSNIGTVLEAIMCNNVYPSQHLGQSAWNQMVLKAFFTEKPVHLIVGLDARSNKELAHILSDYAHERWAAGRTVNPQLWRCVAPFVDATLLGDIERVAQSGDEVERRAAVLVCRQSQYAPCKDLLQQEALKPFAEGASLSWQTIAERSAAAV